MQHLGCLRATSWLPSATPRAAECNALSCAVHTFAVQCNILGSGLRDSTDSPAGARQQSQPGRVARAGCCAGRA
eukprot:276730-Chlamydomonas_euryale.AAC.1